jgi:hypothetical protein
MTVTTLIPAFKPKYLRDLLVALAHQSLLPERVIISDDSPDRAFITAFQSDAVRAATANLNIEVIDGPRKGGIANIRHLLNAWGGSTPLAHLLFDDDVIYPEFYAMHAAVHAGGQFDCSISRRWTALESGQPVQQLPRPQMVAQHPQRVCTLSSDLAFTLTVPGCNNWLGEFSNAVFTRDAAQLLLHTRLADISYEGLGDIGLFLAASLAKPLCYINDPLGYFRLNAEQMTQQTSSHAYKLAVVAWAALGVAGLRLGKLDRERAAQCFRIVEAIITARFSGEPGLAPFGQLTRELVAGVPQADERFVEHWHAFIPAA